MRLARWLFIRSSFSRARRLRFSRETGTRARRLEQQRITGHFALAPALLPMTARRMHARAQKYIDSQDDASKDFWVQALSSHLIRFVASVEVGRFVWVRCVMLQRPKWDAACACYITG